jgi:predicted N-acetyltransferase YhbS
MLKVSHCSSREDLEAVVDLCDRAFANTPRDYFVRHVLNDATLRPEDTLIGTVGGRLVSSVQIFPRVCWVDGATIPFAGIGNVATDPAERRAGYAGELMRESVRRMTERGFPFSMLTTTINVYYQKFGYGTVPRAVAVFDRPPSPARDWTVRRFDPARDGRGVRALYETYNRNSVGPIARDDVYWDAQSLFCGEDPSMFLCAERDGRLCGYIRGFVEKGSAHVLEFAGAESVSAVFATLVSALADRQRGMAVKMFLSDREKERLAPIPPHTQSTDTDTMVLVLDERFRRLVEERIMKPGVLMYWLADFF